MSQYLEDIKKAGLPITNAVMSRLDEIDENAGGLKDHHLKFLIVFVKELFGTDHYRIAIDFVSRPRVIGITPRKNDIIFYSRTEWVRPWLKLQWWQRGGRTLSSFLKLNGWKIVFSRVCAETDIEKKDENMLKV